MLHSVTRFLLMEIIFTSYIVYNDTGSILCRYHNNENSLNMVWIGLCILMWRNNFCVHTILYLWNGTYSKGMPNKQFKEMHLKGAPYWCIVTTTKVLSVAFVGLHHPRHYLSFILFCLIALCWVRTRACVILRYYLFAVHCPFWVPILPSKA